MFISCNFQSCFNTMPQQKVFMYYNYTVYVTVNFVCEYTCTIGIHCIVVSSALLLCSHHCNGSYDNNGGEGGVTGVVDRETVLYNVKVLFVKHFICIKSWIHLFIVNKLLKVFFIFWHLWKDEMIENTWLGGCRYKYMYAPVRNWNVCYCWAAQLFLVCLSILSNFTLLACKCNGWDLSVLLRTLR